MVGGYDENSPNALFVHLRAHMFEDVRRFDLTDANIHSRDKVNQTPLHVACEQGCLDVVLFLLDKGLDVDDAPPPGRFAPLHMAVLGEHLDVARALIERGASVNRRDAWGRTILHYAAEQNDTDMVMFILAQGGDPDIEDLQDHTPSQIAGSEPLKHLLKGLQQREHPGRPPSPEDIFSAALDGKLDKVREFLEAGVDVNGRDGLGRTPLYGAADRDHVAVVRLLIDWGADCDVEDPAGHTPLHEARGVEVAELLLAGGARLDARVKKEHHEGCTPLFFAANHGDARLVAFLIDQGADMSAPGDHNTSPLTFAGNAETAKLLLARNPKARSQLKQVDGFGGTALHWACRMGRADVAVAFLEAGASPAARDRNGQTPVDVATPPSVKDQIQDFLDRRIGLRRSIGE